jgi:hypothetical protein
VSTRHLTLDELKAGLPHIESSPKDRGALQLIVRRPRVSAREVLDHAQLDVKEGLVGDTWNVRSSLRTEDGSPHPDMQLNIMNARASQLVAGQAARWALAGDQLYVDLDLSEANLPAGTRLELGSAVIEITEQPHRGCAKFAERFGRDALRFVNSDTGRELRLRGVNAKVIVAGSVTQGVEIRKLPPGTSAS